MLLPSDCLVGCVHAATNNTNPAARPVLAELTSWLPGEPKRGRRATKPWIAFMKSLPTVDLASSRLYALHVVQAGVDEARKSLATRRRAERGVALRARTCAASVKRVKRGAARALV